MLHNKAKQEQDKVIKGKLREVLEHASTFTILR